MATFKITTTGTLDPVEFVDIGSRPFAHPTTGLDLIAAEGFSGPGQLLRRNQPLQAGYRKIR